MWNRFKSPVVWAVIIAASSAEASVLGNKASVTGWDVAASVFVVAVAAFGAVNNPTTPDKF
jgi:hypothetical protein